MRRISKHCRIKSWRFRKNTLLFLFLWERRNPIGILFLMNPGVSQIVILRGGGCDRFERFCHLARKEYSSRAITQLFSVELKHMYKRLHEPSESTDTRSRFSGGISRKGGGRSYFDSQDSCILSVISLLLGEFERKYESISPMLSGFIV